MKKIFSCMLILTILFSYSFGANGIDVSSCTKRTFKISVYYSPVAGQKFYYRGNFKDEKILNGNGTHGASGKPVFNGMIAAPKNYKFGTKIYFPGLGVGDVQDRGSAIVNAGQRGEKYDRIDIWVGKGDEALARTLSFGKQVRVGYICSSSKNLKVGFDMSKFSILDNFFSRTFWTIGLSSGRTDKRTEILQIYLGKLGYFHANNTGYFGSQTRQALVNFQKDHGITGYYGYFGPETRSKLKQVLFQKGLLSISKNSYKSNSNNLKSKEVETEKPKSDIILVKSVKSKKAELDEDLTKKISKELDNVISKKQQEIIDDLDTLKSGLGRGSNPKQVKILQKYLQKLNFYKGKIDGKYEYQTIDAVAAFQIKYKVITSFKDQFAGYFGPYTNKMLKKVIDEKIIK